MSSSGVVSIRFDVQGNEQLLSILKASSVGIKGFNLEMTGLQTTLAKPMGGQGPLQNMAAGFTAAEGKVTSFRGQLASIGTQLGANATSFGVATASIWGVYNAYDSLEKVQIRAHAAAVKVQTLETSLAALTERRRIAVEKGNLTGEQMAILNEKIANTTEKLSVAQERNADVAQDLQEAWVGFFSTVGPQVVAAGGSIAQLFTTLTTKSPAGISALGQLKTAFTGLISSIGSAGGGAIAGISNVFSKLTSGITGTTKAVGPLDNAMKGAATGTGFLSSGLGAVTIGLGAAALGAVGIIELVGHMQQVMTDAGLKFRESKFGLLDIKNMQFSADQFDAIAKKFEEHGEKINIATATMFPAETLAKFKAFGGQINSITGEIEPLGASISGLGEGFTNTREDFTGWATDLLRGGQQANQVFLWLINSHIKDSDALQILSDATARYKQELLDLGLTTEQYNAVADGANVIIGKYIDRVATGQVPLDSLTESIHKQVTAFAVNNHLTDDQAKAMEKLVLAQLKARVGTVAHTAEIDKERDARYAANEATIQSFVAYNGVNALQGKSIGQMEVFNETIGKSIDAVVEQEVTLRKWADAEAMATDATVNFVNAQFDSIDSMINVNKINDGGVQSLILLRQAHTDGLTAAQDFYTSMVTGAIKTETTTKAIADNAKTVGIQADMMALSASKAQELITTTHEMSTAFSDEALAASKSTAFLKDKVAIDAQIKAGMIDGRQAANDWAASLDKSTAAGKAEHDQLLHLTADMINLPVPISLTNDQLKEVMTNFKLTGDAAGSLADVMSSTLGPSFEHLKGLFDATSMKDFKSSLKDLSISKDLKGDIKDLGKSMVDLAKNRKSAQDTFDVLLQFGDEILKKHPKDWAKFVGDLADKLAKGAGKKGLTDDMKQFIDTIKTMSPDELQSHAESVQMFIDAFQPDSAGGKKVTPDEWAKILAKFNEEGKNVSPSIDPGTKSVNALTSSFGGMIKPASDAAKSLEEFATAQLNIGKSSPLTNLFLSQQIPKGIGGGETQKTPAITPPAPIVFPPPDISNINTAIATIETNIGSILDFVSNLKFVFPAPEIGFIDLAVVHAEENIGTLLDFVTNFVLTFPPMNIDAINSSIATAENNLGSIIDFTSGLVVTFPSPNIEAINQGLVEAENNLGSIIDFMAGLKLVFQKPNTQPITAGATIANATIKTVETLIKGMKLPFNKPTYDQITSAVSAATKSMKSLEGIAKGLKLVFPKPNISNIESAVNAAQKKIDSLHGKNVTNTVTTHYQDSGNKPKARGGVEYRESATTTTWGEAGPEVALFMPLTKAGQPTKGNYDIRIPSPTLDTAGIRNMLRNNRGDVPAGRTGGGGGPTTVNVTTEVYLFPGSDMFKKFVKSIMLEEMSRYAAV